MFHISISLHLTISGSLYITMYEISVIHCYCGQVIAFIKKLQQDEFHPFKHSE